MGLIEVQTTALKKIKVFEQFGLVFASKRCTEQPKPPSSHLSPKTLLVSKSSFRILNNDGSLLLVETLVWVPCRKIAAKPKKLRPKCHGR